MPRQISPYTKASPFFLYNTARYASVALAVALLLCATVDAAAAQVKKRILILGDSWAASTSTIDHDGMPGFGSFDGVLAEYGFATYVTEGATAWGGRRADQFATQQTYRDLVTQTLTNNPDIVIVHLILGGNDFLNVTRSTNVFASPWTAQTRDAQWETIKTNLQSVVNLCLGVRPTIKVLISDYDYLGLSQAYAAYGYAFGGMTQAQLNDAFLELGAKKLALANATERCYYVSNWGVLHHYFSYPSAGLPLPGAYPGYTPYYGGDKTEKMPVAANVGDGIHPNDAAHRHMLRRCMDQFYAEWLRDLDSDALAYTDETRDLDPNTAGTQNPFDPDVADSTGDDFSNAPDGTPDGDNDYDGDGFTNSAELNTYLTSPIVPNTNDDPDEDGLTNNDELAAGTDPLVPDTDGDGLNDGAEVHTHHTNPTLPDSDGDGYSDGLEVKLGTDPNDSSTSLPATEAASAALTAMAILMLGTKRMAGARFLRVLTR